MGGGESKVIISYDQARSWLGWPNANIIEKAFDRLAVGGRLDRETFRSRFLGSSDLSVPTDISNSLFNGFDVQGKGRLSKEDFVCGYAIMHRGTMDAKARLLFNIYDSRLDGHVTYTRLQSFARSLGAGDDDSMRPLRVKCPMYWGPFREWARRNQKHILIAWLTELEEHVAGGLSDESVGLLTSPLERTQSTIQRAEQKEIDDLVRETGLLQSEIDVLCASLAETQRSSPHGVVDATSIKAIFPSIPTQLRTRLVAAFDRSDSGTVSLREFVVGVAICIDYDDDRKRELCLRMFAVNGTAFMETCRALRLIADGGLEPFRTSSLKDSGDNIPDLPADLASGEEVHDTSWINDALEVLRILAWAIRVDLKMLPPDPHEERIIIDSLNKKFDPGDPGRIGATWYVISSRWWLNWCQFTGDDTSSPACWGSNESSLGSLRSSSSHQKVPAIDNTELVDGTGMFRKDLQHHVDYELLPEVCWDVLEAWHSLKGPEIERKVIDLDGVPELDLYPLRLQFCKDAGAAGAAVELECSRVSPLTVAKEEACSVFGIPSPKTIRLMHRADAGSKWELVSDEKATPHSLHFYDGHYLLLSEEAGGFEGGGEMSHIGTGLQNIGNTCYMNSSLQCLLHTRLLREYFDRQYCCDLDPTGKRSKEWGTAGKLPVAFADLGHEIEFARSAVAPERLKRSMSHFKPDFAGWQQHDAQEFLSAMLEGLSEDLNRVHEKPYIELKDSGDRKDEDVAAEYWDAQCRRDWSIVSALFTGQFKSRVVCNTCGVGNSNFESFSVVSVPLPEHDYQWVTCTVVETGPRQMQVCVRVPKRCRVSDIRSAVAGVVGLPEEDLFAADVAAGYIFARLQPEVSFGSGSNPTSIFHAPPAPGTSSNVLVNLVHRRLHRTERFFLNPYQLELFATPQIVQLSTSSKANDLYAHIWSNVRRVVPDYNLESGTWPFKLCRVVQDGMRCSVCGWREACRGHPIPSDGIENVLLDSEETLSLDWDVSVVTRYYNKRSATAKSEHESFGLAEIERDAPEKFQRCLEALLETEAVAMYCRSCTQKNDNEYTEREQTKTFRIWALPPILIFQLKRFRNVKGHSYKLSNLVDFPLQFDAKQFLASGPDTVAGSTLSRNQTVFNLYGVVNHGGGVGGGHYIAYVRTCGDQWTEFNDSRVSSISEDKVVSNQAYLLFYIRNDIETASLSDIFPQLPGALPKDVDAIRKAPLGESRSRPRSAPPDDGPCVVM